MHWSNLKKVSHPVTEISIIKRTLDTCDCSSWASFLSLASAERTMVMVDCTRSTRISVFCVFASVLECENVPVWMIGTVLILVTV
jgi:hypothetical protein